MRLSGHLALSTGTPEPLSAPPQVTLIKSMDCCNFQNAILQIVVKGHLSDGALGMKCKYLNLPVVDIWCCQTKEVVKTAKTTLAHN